MLIVYITLGAFALGGGIIGLSKLVPTKNRRYY